jgi:DHA1 family inner membrane transport protein
VIVGMGLLVGNTLGGRTADANLRLSLILWPAAMIVSLIVAGFATPFKWPFLATAFTFGVASFANVPPMQMRVMKYGERRRNSPRPRTSRPSPSRMRWAA